MNRTYRSVWNQALGAWVATSELGGRLCKGGWGKKSRNGRIALALALSALAPAAFAQAVGSGVASGAGSTAISSPTGCPTVPLAAVAAGAQSIAIGCGAQAAPADTISIGSWAGSGSLNLSGLNRYSISIGNSAGMNTNGGENVSLGLLAGSYATGSGNVGVGSYAGYGVTGGANAMVGSGAGQNVIGSTNVAVGAMAGSYSEGDKNVMFGGNAGQRSKGSYNVFSGWEAGRESTGGDNTLIGDQAGLGLVGSGNNVMGRRAGANSKGDNNVLIGTLANEYVTTGSRVVSIGVQSQVTKNDSIAIGTWARTTGLQSVAVGTGVVGDGITVSGDYSGAFGVQNKVSGARSYAIGGKNTVTANNAVVLGNNVTLAAGLDGAVVLGNNSTASAATPTASTTVNGRTFTYAAAGAAPAPGDVVSVGSAFAPRQIQNVANGQVTATSLDAINGSQLYSVADQLNTTITANKTKYYSVNSTGGGNENNDGAVATDGIASGKDASVAAGATGGVAMGAGATVQTGSFGGVAVGANAKASASNAVALGSDSVSDRAIAGTQGAIPAGANFVVPYNTTDKTLLGAVSVGNATSYRQITNVADGTEQQDAVTVRQLTGALQSFAVSPTKYFHANSVATDSAAVGTDSVAIGPQTVVNGDNGIGMGSGATVQASAPGGVAIGQASTSGAADAVALGTRASANAVQGVAVGAGSSVTQIGGVALGAGSVANTAAGVAGYIPPTATTGQRAAIGATTSTLAAVSVGDAASGQFRQITGVAAGTVDSDAVNVSQLKAVQGQVTQIDQGTVKYDTKTDGAVDYNSVTMGGSSTTGPVTVHNVGEGVAGTDAVNVNQLNGATSKLNILCCHADAVLPRRHPCCCSTDCRRGIRRDRSATGEGGRSGRVLSRSTDRPFLCDLPSCCALWLRGHFSTMPA